MRAATWKDPLNLRNGATEEAGFVHSLRDRQQRPTLQQVLGDAFKITE